MRLIIRGAMLLVAAVVLALVGPAAIAQAATPHAQAQSGSGCSTKVTAQDKAFLRAAHQSNLTEIKAGQLALKKSKNKAVRDLGAMFIRDHTKTDADLKAVAEKLGVSLPSRPNPVQRADAAKLEKLSATAFDKFWIKSQTAGHRKAKATGEKELKKGSNCDVITVDKKSAPVVAHHLMELLDLKADYPKA